MSAKKFLDQTSSLYRLARRQRAAKLGLRALWMAGAGYLFGWGTNSLWGWFPNAKSWVTLAAVLMLLNLAAIIWRPASKKNFLWNLDRKLGFKEQFSAALAAAEAGELEPLGEELLQDTLAEIPDIRLRMRQKGWNLRGERDALLIVLILLLLVYLAGISIVPQVTSLGSGLLPPWGFDPSAGDVFPLGIPGLDSGEAEEMGMGESGDQQGDTPGDQDAPDMSSDELGEVGEVLGELGEALQENAATAELGEALEQGSLEEAAEELERLAGQVGELSQDTRQDLADNFEDAADKLDQPGQQDLSSHLESSAEAIQDGDSAEAGEQMDGLAEELRALAQQAATGPQNQAGNDASSGVGVPESGEPEDFERLDEEGQVFNLDEFSDPSGFLHPALAPEEVSDEVLGGAVDLVGVGDAAVISGNFDPYDLSWMKRDVITTYFSP